MSEPVDGNASKESRELTATLAMANTSDQTRNGDNSMGEVDSSINSSAGGYSREAGANNQNARSSLQPISWEWTSYLNFCRGRPAPTEAFCQNIDPLPVNEFKLKDKLEVVSPDLCSNEAIHLGTVVGIAGPRIRIRLDGCDTSNDFYRMVDADDIHPVGWAQRSGMYYQPPVRFQKDIAGYLDYVERAITRNCDLADSSCFKKPPTVPKKNLFQKGDKLEMVDQKVPSDILPATVVDVHKNMLTIHLIGYVNKNYIKMEYSSRDLFPVGWCKKAGHVLKSPGPRGLLLSFF